MSTPGLGVMLSWLSGSESSVTAVQGALGKRIATVAFDQDDDLVITFDGGYWLRLFDDGQSCCERRYMRTDDQLGDFVGAELRGIELRDCPDVEDADGDAHEVQMLVIQTDKGDLTVSAHNEHNGYYGGFSIRAAGGES